MRIDRLLRLSLLNLKRELHFANFPFEIHDDLASPHSSTKLYQLFFVTPWMIHALEDGTQCFHCTWLWYFGLNCLLHSTCYVLVYGFDI